MPRENKYKISPKDYHKILRGVEIRSISLIDLSYRCIKDEIERNPVRLDLKTDASMKKQVDGIASIEFSFTMTGKIERKVALKITGKYLTEFMTVDEITEDFVAVFKDYSLKLLMTPYLRDLFYSISMRSDLPGIVLPLLKFFPTDKKVR